MSSQKCGDHVNVSENGNLGAYCRHDAQILYISPILHRPQSGAIRACHDPLREDETHRSRVQHHVSRCDGWEIKVKQKKGLNGNCTRFETMENVSPIVAAWIN